MTNILRGLALAATLSLALVPAGFAQDAMATDAMAPTITPISDDEYKLCMDQAGAITFPAVMQAAAAACHGLHMGMDVMATLESMGMGPMGDDAMATDAMSTDAMSTDAMAPATK